MTRTFPLLRHGLLAVLTSAALVLAFSPSVAAQHHRDGGNSGGGKSSGGSGGDSGSSSGGSGGSAHTRPAPTPVSAPSGSSSNGRSAHAVPRGSTGSTGTSKSGDSPSGTTARDGSHDNSGSGNTDSAVTRPRDGRTAVGQAVARPPFSAGGGTTVIVTGGGYGYYPWGYGGLGFGGYSAYYDPWWYDPYPPVYGGGGRYDYDDGALRLKVKPRDASVYVDGYFAGHVDDFDGMFQKLKIEAGPHRVELRLDGYETLDFEVRIDPDRKITYSGTMKALP
jgi:hypothetical protein